MKPCRTGSQGWEEETFRYTAERLAIPTWTHDAAGQIDFVNRRFKEYFGFGLDGATDMVNWSSVMHPIDFNRALPLISHSLACGVPYEGQLRLKPFSASVSAYRFHCMKIVPVDTNAAGSVVKWVGSAIDTHHEHASFGEGSASEELAGDDTVDVVLDTKDVRAVHRALDIVMGFIRGRAGLRADYLAIRLVFFELIGNAVKYAPGMLMLRVDWFGQAPYLHVFDRGRGFDYHPMLPPDILAEGGRGLYLVNSLGGSLAVHRLPGCGAHVSVRLPARRRAVL
jgi:anti-sigma regulatory factor (Ser/Thr protein kinase)